VRLAGETLEGQRGPGFVSSASVPITMGEHIDSREVLEAVSVLGGDL